MNEIPAEVRKVAEKLFYESEPGSTGVVESIARAIMAATLAEREACAVVADSVLQRSNHPAWGATYDLTPTEIADAIRKRGGA